MKNTGLKILVTGYKGMLGFALQKELLSKYQLIGIDIEDADVTDEIQIKNEIYDIKPDIVIHTAAYTNVDNCETNKELCHKVNAIGTLNITNACKLCGAKLIFISTDYIFDGNQRKPYKESDKPNPINTYGKSKFEAEQYILESYSNSLIIRTSWLYGHNGRNFVDTIIALADKSPELRVVNDQTGSPCYTKDIAHAIGLLVKESITGIIHVTNSGYCTWYDLADKILKLSGKTVSLMPITSKESGRPANRPGYSVLDTKKYVQIAHAPLRPWEEALSDYINNRSGIQPIQEAKQ